MKRIEFNVVKHRTIYLGIACVLLLASVALLVFKGFNLVEALGECAPLLEKYGGHELAAGLTIKRENLPAFREKLNACAREKLRPADLVPELEAECELEAGDLTLEQANRIFDPSSAGSAFN